MLQKNVVYNEQDEDTSPTTSSNASTPKNEADFNRLHIQPIPPCMQYFQVIQCIWYQKHPLSSISLIISNCTKNTNELRLPQVHQHHLCAPSAHTGNWPVSNCNITCEDPILIPHNCHFFYTDTIFGK